MSRVLAEVSHVQKRDTPKTIHDLRTALRRCRSMADGWMELDADADWSKMEKASGRLFGGLGELRDLQVMGDWLAKLVPQDDPVRVALTAWLETEEREAARAARKALGQFDRKQWKRWLRALPARTRRVPADGLVLQHAALLRFEAAHELHREALRRRGREAWHRLRLGVKRFRYSVENFLPTHHEQWGSDLKRMQDLLGEVHDLDVLRDLPRHAGIPLAPDASKKWRARFDEERGKRLGEYKASAAGSDSVWTGWRAGLPEGKRLETAAIAWVRAWAGYRDTDWQQRRRLVSLALQLFDGLAGAQVNVVFNEPRYRRILYAAALTQNVGRAEGVRGHHKRSYRMIRDMQPPVGWTSREMLWTALAARYHRGAEPREGHEGFAALAPADRNVIVWLAGVLRLANAMVASRPNEVEAIRVESSGAIHIWAYGLREDASSKEDIEEKKHLLEVVSHRPVLIHAVGSRKLQRKMAS